ncbi:DUF2800 domain-containing protein [Salmonella enterica]|nr:DUF2800 domain-containing protein [Salmonella enterica]
MTDLHAKLSPSAAHRWRWCKGSLALEQFEPDSESEYAVQGSTAHRLAEIVLTNRQKHSPEYPGCDVRTYTGTYPLAHPSKSDPGYQVDEEMAEKVGEYVEAIWQGPHGPGELRIEYRCDFSDALGIPGQFGTADAVILAGNELQIHDLKYGFNRIDATENPQLMLYALGALSDFELVADITQIRMVIHQPRINHRSEYVCDVNTLREFGENMKAIAAEVLALAEQAADGKDIPDEAFLPGGHCRYCKVKDKCRPREQYVFNIVADDFIDLSRPLEPQLSGARERLINCDSAHLAECYRVLDIIEAWCSDVRARVNGELHAGHAVPGFKLVAGKPGNRAWSDEARAEETLTTFRIKGNPIYTRKLISPTQAEKLFKSGAISERRWPKLTALITRPEGKPTVVPESDPRPALVVNVVDDFDDVSVADLL